MCVERRERENRKEEDPQFVQIKVEAVLSAHRPGPRRVIVYHCIIVRSDDRGQTDKQTSAQLCCPLLHPPACGRMMASSAMDIVVDN